METNIARSLKNINRRALLFIFYSSNQGSKSEEEAKKSKMNTSHFMDKQILDLMSPQSQPQPQEESSTRHINGDTPTTKEEILASYDFQPIRTVGSSPPRTSSSAGTVTAPGPSSSWGSLDSRMASSNLKVT